MILNRRQKRLFSKLMRKGGPARPVVSLSDAPRRGYRDDDTDGFFEYGFLPERLSDADDDVIDAVVDSMREEINSPYDCTGLRFTMWIDWHRNPSGRVSYVHRYGIDC